ncbi:MAG: biotin--[Oscillospiraceae bacterium]|nr:biotin--[acetyl-CoA-carboxylase] ligase [Oscillospiraceae bacterium]
MQIKERVLELLESHRGERISGETIAETLSVSRNAVWKAIRTLRAEGYAITAATNSGYCLAAENDVLSAAGIRALLPPEFSAYASLLQVYPTLESTNRTAKELALAGAAHGTAVIAAAQTAGRGRCAREFFSPPGGLYMSVILHPDRLCFSEITAVTAFAAVAVCETLEAVSGRKPQIKWVNDIFLDGKKVCGILTEGVTDLETGALGWVAVGIGINVSTPAEAFPEPLRSIAAPVFPDASQPDAKNRIAAGILTRLLGTPPEQDALFAAYADRLMLLGQEVTVVQGEREFRAVAAGIDSVGHLRIRMHDGTEQTLSAGEIRILPE